MCFYKRTLRIPGTEYVNNEKVLKNMEQKVHLYSEPKRGVEISWKNNEEGELGKFDTHSGSPT